MLEKAKIYYDGSHYVAMPQKRKKCRNRSINRPKEKIEVNADGEAFKPVEGAEYTLTERERDDKYLADIGLIDEPEKIKKCPYKSINGQNEEKILVTREEIFDRVYEENMALNKRKLKDKLYSELKSFFASKDDARYFIDVNLMRARKNLNGRRNRAWKKARLAFFNYFCTFTYDDNKVDEHTFKKRLKKLLSNLNVRKGWKYMGVWERGEKTGRSHFHALVSVPEGGMVGSFR